MKKFMVGKCCSWGGVVFVVLCFVSAALAVFYFLNRFFVRNEHDKKWSDYDDCGVF